MKKVLVVLLALMSFNVFGQFEFERIKYAAVKSSTMENALEFIKTTEFYETTLAVGEKSIIFREVIEWDGMPTTISIIKLHHIEKPMMCNDGYYDEDEKWQCNNWLTCIAAQTYDSGNSLWLFKDENDGMYYLFYILPI